MIAYPAKEFIRINNVDAGHRSWTAMNAQSTSGALIRLNNGQKHSVFTDLTRLRIDNDCLVLFRAIAITDFASQALPRKTCAVVNRSNSHLCFRNIRSDRIQRS